jgi:type II restriction/modification system DNA methylase subunit YeeA
MAPEQFISKWQASTLTERAAAQSHFNDLCDVLQVERPTDADPKGEWYCFERGAAKTAGGDGWADVWKRGHFGWEYKGKRKNLSAAYAQLQQYAVALENPPLLVVSDMDRIVVHTNWTNTVSEVHTISLSDLLDANKRELLRWIFSDPERLRPQKTTDALTSEVADNFAKLAISLGKRGHDPQVVAHFLNRLVFCMFAEDIELLPKQVFSRIVDAGFQKPEAAQTLLGQLFAAMANRGGYFGTDEIEWFNGGLFDDDSTLPLTRDDLKLIGLAASHNWSDIDPSIFGTLFERDVTPANSSI